MLRLLRRFLEWLGDSPSQWEHERRERHRLGNELVRRWKVRQLRPRKESRL